MDLMFPSMFLRLEGVKAVKKYLGMIQTATMLVIAGIQGQRPDKNCGLCHPCFHSCKSESVGG